MGDLSRFQTVDAVVGGCGCYRWIAGGGDGNGRQRMIAMSLFGERCV